MSLFGNLLGDFEDDQIFGSHMRTMQQMNSMMNSMFSDPFGMFNMGPPAIRAQNHVRNEMMPFGFPTINSMFRDMDNMQNNGNCHSYSSSTVMTMSNGPDGRPQVYQASSSTRSAPGGIKETKKSVCDSRTGLKKMAIGHHIGERSHVMEREHNMNTGEQEEHQEFINLEEEEAELFDHEFRQRSRQVPSHQRYLTGYDDYSRGTDRRQQERQLALPPAPSSSYKSDNISHRRRTTTPYRSTRRY